MSDPISGQHLSSTDASDASDATAAAAMPPPPSKVSTVRRQVFTAPRPAEGAEAPPAPAAATKPLPRLRAKDGAKRQRAATSKPRAPRKKNGEVAAPATNGAAIAPPSGPPAIPQPPSLEAEPEWPIPTAAGVPNVFDGMTECFSDESFLRDMNVSQDFVSQDEVEVEDTLDNDQEGFLESTPKGSQRSVNYTIDEDKLLCLTWKKIGLDATVGTEQQRNTYWLHTKKFFDANNKSGNDRSAISIRHRWSTIQMDCQKWSACIAHVLRLNPSGTNDQDKPKKGKKPDKPFTLHHCWAELEHDEKWKKRDALTIPNKNPKSSVGEAKIIVGDEDDDTSSGEEGKRSPTPTNSVANTKRPTGRKQAKEKGKKNGDDDMKESLEAMINVRKGMQEEKKQMRLQQMEEMKAFEERRALAEERLAAAEEKKAEVEERKVDNGY